MDSDVKIAPFHLKELLGPKRLKPFFTTDSISLKANIITFQLSV